MLFLYIFLELKNKKVVIKFYSCNMSDGNSQLKGEIYVLCIFQKQIFVQYTLNSRDNILLLVSTPSLWKEMIPRYMWH